MLVSEEEAKTKWCPQARVQIFNEPAPQSAPNRAWSEKEGSFMPHAAGCIASRCMFWRWGGDKLVPLLGAVKVDPRTGREVPATDESVWVPHGFCGAGGRP